MRNTWKVLKYGAGGWRKSVGQILREMEKCYKGSKRKEYLTYRKRKEG
jgi:hypothetical protein